MSRVTVPDVADSCAMAAPMSVPCSKYTFKRPMPLIDCDSIFEMPPTVVE